ncbi:unnamed protein product [Caenorhabditis auriculariae]|uniref:Uncharacterized protein n=1 Tax=Caenorhabditis auriculariae TaxID=2777116 RepID=A0A8S1GUP1_9PELO|nr:unnamed protein product [Caenorhabditis auriculariae]
MARHWRNSCETEASGVPGRLLAARMSEKAAVATPLFPPPSSYWSERMMTNGLERKTPTRFGSEACSRRKEGDTSRFRRETAVSNQMYN